MIASKDFELRPHRCELCGGRMQMEGYCAPEMRIEYDDGELFWLCVDCGHGWSLGLPTSEEGAAA